MSIENIKQLTAEEAMGVSGYAHIRLHNEETGEERKLIVKNEMLRDTWKHMFGDSGAAFIQLLDADESLLGTVTAYTGGWINTLYTKAVRSADTSITVHHIRILRGKHAIAKLTMVNDAGRPEPLVIANNESLMILHVVKLRGNGKTITGSFDYGGTTYTPKVLIGPTDDANTYFTPAADADWWLTISWNHRFMFQNDVTSISAGTILRMSYNDSIWVTTNDLNPSKSGSLTDRIRANNHAYLSAASGPTLTTICTVLENESRVFKYKLHIDIGNNAYLGNATRRYAILNLCPLIFVDFGKFITLDREFKFWLKTDIELFIDG